MFTVELIYMNTTEAFLKCRHYLFSLGYAAKNYMTCSAQLNEAVG